MRNNFLWQCMLAYTRSKIKTVLLFVFFAAIFTIVLKLYNIRYDAAIYAAVLCIVTGLVAGILDFVRYYNKRKTLMKMTDRVTFTIDDLPKAGNKIEEDYQRLLHVLFQNQSRIIDETTSAKSFMSDYYALWVHQIKVPIAAMHLLMDDKEKNSPLALELFKIEQYVEMALSYVRLKSDYTDYLIKSYDLETIVKQAVRKYAPMFIAKKIVLDIKPIEVQIITDEKWLQFVIEQILSNSLKYTKKGTISIYMEKSKILVIEDTGIGIAPEDIKRIGEKGFTGYNGRQYKKSTGLGLYLCKEILDRLSHKLTISSQVGEGTKVSLNLESRTIQME